MSKWIKKLTEAYSEVNVNENKKMATAKALAKSTASSEKGKAAVTLPKAPFDIPKKADKMPIAKKGVNELNKSTLGSYIKKAHPDAASQASSATKLAAMGADTDANKASKKAKNRTAGIATAADKLAKESADLNTANADKAIQHDCATHVEHTTWGKGTPISGEHTIVETTEGHGYVTHYDVMFEHGIEKNVSVKDLDILSEMSHGHSKKKKNEAMDPVNHKALKGKHKDRDDTDIDNDGDTDSSDKYLHKRRKAISKNVKDGDEVEMNPKLNKKAKGAATSKGDAEMAESTLPSVYARILENRAAHYKKAAPAQDKEDGLSPMAKKAKADMEAGAKMDDTEEKGHVDAAKAGRAGPSRKPRRNDNMKGDKSVISSATKMKEAFAAVYDTSTYPLILEKTTKLNVHRSVIGQTAYELGGSGSIGHGAHELMHPDEHGGPNKGASAYGHVDKKTKKFSAVAVKFGHTTSAKKVAKAMGHKEVGPHHHAIADWHNETEAGVSHSFKD